MKVSIIKTQKEMKRIIFMIIPALICGIVFISCNDDYVNNTEELRKHNKKKISIIEGIWGTLVQTEGNCMPGVYGGIYGKNKSCKQYPIQREIMVYEYTTWEETEYSYPPFFEKVYTKLIATTTCDKDGFFEFELKPGQYSVFIKENEFLYAKSYYGQGIMPVTVETSKISEINLNLDYASY